ncbi:fructose-bisphosphatase class II [Candidatus Curtissbacteria bacterium]|nr:fructose-bisphosphatase class II [Candidatus Curtissbacteria bacterium]
MSLPPDRGGPIGLQPGLVVPAGELREFQPPGENVPKIFGNIVSNTSAEAYRNMIRLIGPHPILEDLPEEIYKPRAKEIDNAANATFDLGLVGSGLTVHIVGDEAQKDIDKGHDGIEASFGRHGNGAKHVWVVRDVVEGTKLVAHNRPNAMSIAAVSTVGGLMETPIRPDDGKRVGYMRKIFVPKGVDPNSISLDQPPEENIKAVARAFGINPRDIHLVTMERKCNQAIIRAAEALGADVTKIDVGDLAWCMRASLWTPQSAEKLIIYMGRGGWEEGEIAHVVAKLVGAPAQGRIIYEKADIEIKDETSIFTAREAVPGAAEETFVVFSPITPNEHFGVGGVTQIAENTYRVNRVLIGNQGIYVAHQDQRLVAA